MLIDKLKPFIKEECSDDAYKTLTGDNNDKSDIDTDNNAQGHDDVIIELHGDVPWLTEEERSEFNGKKKREPEENDLAGYVRSPSVYDEDL